MAGRRSFAAGWARKSLSCLACLVALSCAASVVTAAVLWSGFGSPLLLVVAMNNCLHAAVQNTSGGYRKSGQPFGTTSEVFTVHQSSAGLPGFLNYRLPSDKASSHNYNRYYDDLLAPYVERSRASILEVGVKMGGSLMLWRELFPHDATIYGIDLDPSVPQFEKDAHMKVLAGVGSFDPAVSDTFQGIHFDVIIDDGSHLAVHQLKTLKNLWRHLTSDGLYIIEDVQNDCAVLRQLWDVLPEVRRSWTVAQLARTTLPAVAQFVNASSSFGQLWVTVHEDVSGERFFAMYPAGSPARACVPRRPRCAMGGAPGPPCEQVMVPCDPQHHRSA